MDTKNADKLLRKTKDNYDAFAESFSQTRGYIPTQMERLLIGRVHEGDNVLDVGCGNGRYYPIFAEKKARYRGIDISTKLIDIAKRKYPGGDFAVGDALFLPFKSNEFDLFFSIAVLHHIPSREYRKRFFLEAFRALKPGGRVIVMVWDLRFRSMVKLKNWRRMKDFLAAQAKALIRMDKLDFGDFFIPWQKQYKRYVHRFRLEELERLARENGFEIEESGISKAGRREANLYIVAKKVQN
jgi:tRNA (uracil-5-)-methyltransferase TRM9